MPARRDRAHAFDARQQLLEQRGSLPSDLWTTAALLRLVRDELTTPPWDRTDEFSSGLRATSALARLGERGLPPDALVRTGLGTDLRRAVTRATLQLVWTRAERPGARVPESVRPWLEALLSCPDQVVPATEAAPRFSVLSSTALAGDFKDVVDGWLVTACMRDLVAWTFDGTAAPALDEDDLALRGGEEAVRWVCERFSATSLADWSRCSLEWELRQLADAAGTADDAGVIRPLLDERVVVRDELVGELAHRLARPTAKDPLVGGLTRGELQEHVLSLLNSGGVSAATALLRDAVRLRPGDDELRNMLGFCLVASAPSEALLHLDRATANSDLSAELLRANRAAAALRTGDRAAAIDLLVDLRDSGSDQVYLLWDPNEVIDLTAEPAAIQEVSAAEWARSVLRLMPSTLAQ